MNPLMNIGDAAKAAGVSPKMVRQYEQTGLLPPAERTESGYRLYGQREVSVLRFIRQSRRLGFSVPQIAELIGRWGDDGQTVEKEGVRVEHKGKTVAELACSGPLTSELGPEWFERAGISANGEEFLFSE